MFSSIEFLIALRYLRAKRKEKFISITAIFAFVGIMLGVAVLIVVMSVMNGFREDLLSRIIGVNAHISLIPKYESKIRYQEIIDKIKSNIGGIKYINPVVESQAMFTTGDRTNGGMIRGIRAVDLKNKREIYNSIDNKEIFKDFDTENNIIIGKSLAQLMSVHIGEEIKIISPQVNSSIVGAIPKVKTYVVGEIFESGLYEYDSVMIFVPFELAQKQFDKHNSANSIEIFLDDVNSVVSIKEQIMKLLGEKEYFTVIDWKNSNASFIEALNVEKAVMFLILSLIILIATFNIISSLTMLVMDKNKQIALLKTIGMSNGSIMRIFFIAGGAIGVFGTVIGGCLGVLVALNLPNIKSFLETIFDVNLFNPTVYYLTQLPSKLVFSDVMLTLAMSILLSLLSTIYPARKASKINPAEVLRYE